MRKLSLFILVLISQTSIAQQKIIDSLFAEIQKGDIKKTIASYNNLSDVYVYDSPKLAKNYALQAIQLATKNNDLPGLGDGFNRLGITYDVGGQYDSSIFFYKKALKIYSTLGSLKGRGSANNNLGLIYWNLGDFDMALTYFFSALDDFETIKNEKFMANALNNIGLVYADTKNYKLSLQYHFKANKIFEKLGNSYLIGSTYTNIGNDYTSLLLYDTAMYFYRNAIQMQQKANDDYGLSIAYNGYAGNLNDLKKYDSSLFYFNKSLALKKSMNELVGISSIYSQMYDVYMELKNKPKALLCINTAKNIAEQNNLKDDLIGTYKSLSTYYEPISTDSSLLYYKKYSAIKDTIFNEKSNKQITELNTKYETSKKEQQLVEQKIEINKKNFFVLSLASSIIILLLASYYLYRKRSYQNKIHIQKEVLKQQDMATKAIILAEENERKRIAIELHDGVGQMMSVAKMNLSIFENELQFAGQEQRNNFENVIQLVDDSCKEIRQVSHQMMPNALLINGLAVAVKEFISKIDSRILKVTLHAEGLQERLDINVETVLYRVIQECVNNVLKHSQANHLDIALLNEADGIAITIEDNGKGFDTSKIISYEGIGLKNIASRVNFLKGIIDYSSSENKGTSVAIFIPIVQ